MNKNDNLNNKESLAQVASLIVGILIAMIVFDGLKIGCPIKYITGVSCAGCGMTRAFFSAAKLEFSEAFRYHPLFLVVPVAIVVFLVKKKMDRRFSDKIYKLLMWVMITAFVLVYVIRLIDSGNDVVVFEPENGLLYRIYEKAQGIFV